ncbi:hypothetical protein C8J57DRAFT_1518395 [Mycena rebaudengoi]|nr:hypothetical protein C8J57DRAFT_1518395 [Mycena rebaudengoi]
MTDLAKATTAGTSLPAAGSATSSEHVAVSQLLTAALAALNGPGASDTAAIALLSAALTRLTTSTPSVTDVPASSPAGTAVGMGAAEARDATATPMAVATPAPAAAANTTPTLQTSGPWVVEGLYLVVPTGPLTVVIDDGEEHLWYCITKGRYVGVTTVNALAIGAVSGVSSGSMISHKTQALAMASFNSLLSFGLVEIR